MQMQTYIPEKGGKGRKVAKNIFILMALVSFVSTGYLLQQVFTWECSTGDNLVTKNRCNELYENQRDAISYRVEQADVAREDFVANNQDLFN